MPDSQRSQELVEHWKALGSGVITRASLSQDHWELVVNSEQGSYRITGPISADMSGNAEPVGVEIEKI
jgi:hypothetical protein